MAIVNFPSSEQLSGRLRPTYQTPTGNHFQGTYTLVTLRVKLKNNSLIDLEDVFIDMEVYEDVYKYSIEGTIRIRDFVGGQEKFLITGGEELAIVATKPNGNNEIIVSRKDLVITSVSNILLDQGNAREYALHFRSKTTINSAKNKLFTSFGKDRNLESVVKKIFREANGSSTKLSIAGANIHLNNPFVCSGMRPLDAINFLAKRACKNKDFYLFFERFTMNPTENFSHVFVGANTLRQFWEQQSSIPKLYYEPNVDQINYIHDNESEEFLHCNYLRIEPNFDHMANIRTGFYNSRVRKINVLNRTYDDTKINYLEEKFDDVYRNKLMDKSLIFSDSGPPTIERLIVNPSNDPIEDKDQWIKYDTLGAIINSGIRLVVQVSGGGNKICVGSLIELSVPSDIAKSLRADSVLVEDELYSGKYMVTAVKHEFTPKTYNKTLELSRGSMKFNIDNLVRKYRVENTDIL